jgi:hypothetical protein
MYRLFAIRSGGSDGHGGIAQKGAAIAVDFFRHYFPPIADRPTI